MYANSAAHTQVSVWEQVCDWLCVCVWQNVSMKDALPYYLWNQVKAKKWQCSFLKKQKQYGQRRTLFSKQPDLNILNGSYHVWCVSTEIQPNYELDFEPQQGHYLLCLCSSQQKQTSLFTSFCLFQITGQICLLSWKHSTLKCVGTTCHKPEIN